jgi:Uma2 family endonuclease
LHSVDDDGIVVVESMDVSAAPKLMTLDEYLATPETVLPAELAYGALRVSEAPTARHQSAVACLFRALDAHVRARALGRVWLAPLDVVLDARRALVVQPDLMVITNTREWIVRDRIVGPPDLVIEVLSPNARVGSIDERLGWFAEYGVRECWLAHLDRRDLTVIACAGKRIAERRVYRVDEAVASAILPDFHRSFESVLAEQQRT